MMFEVFNAKSNVGNKLKLAKCDFLDIELTLISNEAGNILEDFNKILIEDEELYEVVLSLFLRGSEFNIKEPEVFIRELIEICIEALNDAKGSPFVYNYINQLSSLNSLINY